MQNLLKSLEKSTRQKDCSIIRLDVKIREALQLRKHGVSSNTRGGDLEEQQQQQQKKQGEKGQIKG